MARTLREVVETLPHGTRLLPGHGPATDLTTELRHNPFLG
jgi:glyoxylase-like metal-dependent hydrolase (beta-lactamase superfamily II)